VRAGKNGLAGDAVRGAETLFAWRLLSSCCPNAHFSKKAPDLPQIGMAANPVLWLACGRLTEGVFGGRILDTVQWPLRMA
jgi:hypothetical protein